MSSAWPDSTALGAVTCDLTMGELVINSISLNDAPAWCCWDLSPLWFGAKLKGKSFVEQPDADGAWAYPQYRAATTVSLGLIISGYYSNSGSRYSNPYVGFQTNLKYLRDNLFDMRASGVPVASWSATLTMPDGSDLTADVQLDDLTPGKHVNALFSCSFSMTILQGAFT